MGKSSHSSPSTRTSSSITPPANTHLPTLDNSRPLITKTLHPCLSHPSPTGFFTSLPRPHATPPSVAVPNTPLCRSAQPPPLSQPPMIATIISSPNLSNRGSPDLSRVYRDVGLHRRVGSPPSELLLGVGIGVETGIGIGM